MEGYYDCPEVRAQHERGSAAAPADAKPVRVISGPFKGFDGWATTKPDGGCDVVVSMFGRNVPVVLEASQLEWLGVEST